MDYEQFRSEARELDKWFQDYPEHVQHEAMLSCNVKMMVTPAMRFPLRIGANPYDTSRADLNELLRYLPRFLKEEGATAQDIRIVAHFINLAFGWDITLPGEE